MAIASPYLEQSSILLSQTSQCEGMQLFFITIQYKMCKQITVFFFYSTQATKMVHLSDIPFSHTQSQ